MNLGAVLLIKYLQVYYINLTKHTGHCYSIFTCLSP